MTKICVLGEKICFNADTDLERYRVESILDKEPETIAWIKSWPKHNGSEVFFDIGANIGIYSLFAAYTHSNVHVYAFEPVANNYMALLKNESENNFENLHLFNLALSKDKKLTDIYLSDLRVGNSGAQIDSPVNDKGDTYKALRVEKVLSVSIDQLITEFNFPTPSYVKIDVDGHESDILNGMLTVLGDKTLKSVLVEFNGNDDFEFWKGKLSDFGMMVDNSFDDVPNHSGIRRQNKGSATRNYIFTRK